MKSREITEADLNRAREIHEAHHGFNFSNPLINVGSSVIENDEGLIVGVGYLRPIVEAIMYLDLSQPLRVKSEALKLMIRDGVYFADKFGMNQLHLFAEDPQFRKVLEKHFDFKEPKAKALVRDI